MRIPCLLALVLLPVPVPAMAEEDTQLWLNTTVQGRSAGGLLYWIEAQPRFGGRAKGPEQLLLRPMVGVQVSRRVSLHQGFAHVVTYSAASEVREERSFQQVGWTIAASPRGELWSRTRVEERWRAVGGMGLRVRQMVRGEHAFTASGKGVRALGSAEVFVGANDTRWGQRVGFDQLRSFAGLEVPVGAKSTIETGYLNQAIDRGAAGWRVNHVGVLSLFVRP